MIHQSTLTFADLLPMKELAEVQGHRQIEIRRGSLGQFYPQNIRQK
jgi:hypothetical protein